MGGVADKLKDIGILLTVYVKTAPFLTGFCIYSVGMKVLPVCQVYVGEFNTGRVVLPVQGCRDREVVVIEFLLFREAERYAALSF